MTHANQVGIIAAILALAFVLPAPADATLSVLHDAQAGLVADANNNLYGTAPEGGAHSYCVASTLQK